VRAETTSQDVVMSEAPSIDYIYSRRKTVPYPRGRVSPAQLQDYLARSQVSYVLVAPAIAWRNVYEPIYSPHAVMILQALRGLEAQGKVRLAYYSTTDRLQVYQVLY
jgi:hypothetical protein